jgi:hypothetical protein
LERVDSFKLSEVHYLPKEFEPGILYFSKEFEVAGHLCPCGCENKIITPINPIEWTLEITKHGPTLYPSIGNWQLPCKSHYWITRGEVEWSYEMSVEEIIAGNKCEEERREKYYETLQKKSSKSILRRISKWLKKLLNPPNHLQT